MKIDALGHVVLKVSDLDRSRAFYGALLGLKVSAVSEPWRMIFFTLGDHHNVAIQETDGPVSEGGGVDHVAFKIAGGLKELAAAKRELDAAGVESMPIDHNVSYSLYFSDPDGNKLEVYVDGIAGWEDDPKLILTEAKMLELSSLQ